LILAKKHKTRKRRKRKLCDYQRKHKDDLNGTTKYRHQDNFEIYRKFHAPGMRTPPPPPPHPPPKKRGKKKRKKKSTQKKKKMTDEEKKKQKTPPPPNLLSKEGGKKEGKDTVH